MGYLSKWNNYTEMYAQSQPVSISIEFDGLTRTLPVNPSELTIQRSASNTNIDIIGLGPAVRKAHPGLITMSIKSFFPDPRSNFYVYDVTPVDYIDFITNIWETENINNHVAKLVTKGLDKDFSMWFVIDNFEYSYKGGDFDIGYTLSIKEYVPYGAKVEDIQSQGMGSVRPESTTTVPDSEEKTYVVQPGDSLWSIAKRCCGNGDNWRALYDLNASVIGSNPNLIRPGQVLILPETWDRPKNLTTTKSTKNTGSKTSPNKGTNEVISATMGNDGTEYVVKYADGKVAVKDATSGEDIAQVRGDSVNWSTEKISALRDFYKSYNSNKNRLDTVEKYMEQKGLYGATNRVWLSRDKAILQEDYRRIGNILANKNVTDEQVVKLARQLTETELALASHIDKDYEMNPIYKSTFGK